LTGSRSTTRRTPDRFIIKVPHNLLADGDIFESFCEHEGDRIHPGHGMGKETNP
jgi:hypothetical protein